MSRPVPRIPRGGSKVQPAPGRPTARGRGALLLVFGLLTLLALRLVYVQGIDPTGQAAKAMDERLISQELVPERGSITDRSGNILAASVRRYDVVVDQRLVKDFEEWDRESRSTRTVRVDDRLRELAQALDMPEEDVRKASLGTRPYSVVKHSVTPEVRARVLELRVPGLLTEPVDRRTYPNGAVAGSVLGFVSQDGTPMEGLERSQDAVMTGTPGKRRFEVGADGIRIPHGLDEETPAVDGADLRLTLDKDSQWFAQELIAGLAAEHEAEWANAVVVDVRTGDILVMADSTTVDPAKPEDTPERFRTSTVVSSPYEPGSTGKALPVAAALDMGTVTPETPYTVPSSMEFDGQTIKDFSPHATYPMTVAGIYARSYNTGTVQVAETMSDEQRYEYMRSFGVGQPIDVGLPSPATSVLVPPGQWDGRQRLVTAFGQGYTQTTLHTAQMYQALANGGTMLPVRLIDATVDADGAEKRWDADREPHRVVSEQTSDEMLRLMETVVTQGTSKAAQIPGYRVGGKSSTAEAAGPTGRYDGYNFGFTAVAPLDDPRFVVSVSLHRPVSGGSKVTTQAAARLMEHMLRQANVPANGAAPYDYRVFVDDPQDRPW